MTHVTCRLTAKNRDHHRNPTLGNRVWASFLRLAEDSRFALLCAVKGLDNFRVGMPSAFPSDGAIVDPDSYRLCADASEHTIATGSTVTVACTAAVTAQYVIIQSLDSAAEKLCLAEVAVYAAGQYCQCHHIISYHIISGICSAPITKRT